MSLSMESVSLRVWAGRGVSIYFCTQLSHLQVLLQLSMEDHVKYGSRPNHNTNASQDVRRVDYEVQRLGGRTSVSSTSITCVKRSDDQVSLRRRIIELNRENGTLQHENEYFTTLANDVLVSLKASIRSHISSVPDFLEEGSTTVPHISAMVGSRSQTPVHHRPHADGSLGFKERADLNRGFSDAPSVAKEEEQEEAEPERRCTGPELVDWFESEGRICSITGGLMFRLRDSDITLSSETASMVQSDKPSDCARSPATQFFIEDRNPLNSAPMDQVDSHKEKGKGMQGHTWPYVEPLQITHQQYKPIGDGDSTHPTSNARRRLAMLHFERQYYERLVNEVRARFLPTIRHQIRELNCVLHEFGVEEDRLRDLLKEQIRVRTPEDPS
ncbi:unnamed protein product [Fusarium graminearum]|uniref:Uncharacterized protein n=1 Tax=Gibberella zeae TaxID=5518 RepID=A0A9N8RM75_GIBZA|nr:unnamed protein product [Fusarium graminearum]